MEEILHFNHQVSAESGDLLKPQFKAFGIPA